MSKTYCNIIQKGLFVSHQGVSLCCINPDKQHIKPSEFWTGTARRNALTNIKNEKKVKGCDICYSNEEKKTPSTRLFLNSYNSVASKELPTMLDLDFSNFCNLKCVMCSATRSSEWAKDLGNDISAVSKETIDDLLSISQEVKEITIQGGEPSIMKEYEYYFELLHKKNILKNVNLQVITNATNLNVKFYKLLEKFNSVRLSVSIDAFGKANDYIRWPSNFEQIEKNLIKMGDLNNTVRVEVHNSLNTLSLFNFKDFLFWCKKIEDIYSKKNKYFGVVPVKVISPRKYSPFLATSALKEKYVNDVEEFFSKTNLTHNSNFKTEIMMLLHRLQKTETDESAISELLTDVKKIDSQRKVKITDYIPDFYQYLPEKTQ